MKTSRLAKTGGIALASSMLLMGALPVASAMAASKPAVMLTGPSDVNQTAGSNVTYTASSSNVSNPVYQFWVEEPNGTWTMARGWSSSNTFTLKNVQDGDYLVTAYVAPKTNTKDTTNEQTNGQQAVDGVFVDTSITVSAPSTLTAGQPVTVTASSANIYDAQYQFWYKTPSGVWMQSGNYGSSSYTFTPTETGSYEFVAYAKSPLALNDPEGAAMSTNTATTSVGVGAPALSNISVSGETIGTGSESSPATLTSTGSLTLSTTLMDSSGNPVADTGVTYVFEDGSYAPTVSSSSSITSTTSGSGANETYNYEVYTNAQGAATITVSDPGISTAYTVYATAPYEVNGATLETTDSYLEFVSGDTAAISPAGTDNVSAGTVVPVTVTLPMNSAGDVQTNAAVPLEITNGAYFTNSAGTADYGTYQTLYTNSTGQATFYVVSPGVLSAGGVVELNSGASPAPDFTLSSTPTITWTQPGVATQLSGALSVSGANERNGTYSASAGSQVTISGEVEDAAGNPVANQSLIVVANSTGNGTDSYVQNGTTTVFPTPGGYAANEDTATNFDLAGSPEASTAYGELITANSAGEFSFTVTNSNPVWNGYEVYAVNDGQILTASPSGSTFGADGSVYIDWTNATDITSVGLGDVSETIPTTVASPTSGSIAYDDTALTGMTVPVSEPNGNGVVTPNTFVGVEPFAGEGQFSGAATYSAVMSASGTIDNVYVQTGTDTEVAVSSLPSGGVSAVTIQVTPSGTAGDYSVTVNGQLVNETVTSPLVELGVSDAYAQDSTLSVTSNNQTGTAAFTFETSATNGYGDTAVTPSLDTLNAGQSGTFTLTVEDNNGNPILDTMVPISYGVGAGAISDGSSTTGTLWITAVNGVELETTNGSGVVEAMPIPLGSSSDSIGYGSVAIPSVVTWAGPSSGTFSAMSNASGIVTLTIANGGVPYWSTTSNSTDSNGVAYSTYLNSLSAYFSAGSSLSLTNSNANGSIGQIDW